MATKKQQQETGTGAIVAGGGLTAYGAAHAPVLRSGYKDKSKMVNASPKQQSGRYQAELHQAMQGGKVKTDSTVHVLRTPSGRHINAGGTHRHIARQAMGKPSRYEIKDISHELHVSPVQRVQGKMRVAAVQRGSKRAEAGKKVKPVGTVARMANRGMAAAADANDAQLWKNPHAVRTAVKEGRRAGLVSAGLIAGTGALVGASGLHQRHEWKKTHPGKVGKAMTMDEISKRTKYEANMKVPEKTRAKYGAAGLAGYGAAGVGGAMVGRKAGQIGGARIAEGAAQGKLFGPGSVMRHLGHGYKAAIHTKGGKAGAALAAAGIAGVAATGHQAKKKGVVIPVKKAHTVSAFGVDHRY